MALSNSAIALIIGSPATGKTRIATSLADAAISMNKRVLNLLSFRANDKSFCQQGSQEMRMAERVISHFSNDRIILKQVSQEKPLNQFFQEMIAGTITEDDLGNLLQG